MSKPKPHLMNPAEFFGRTWRFLAKRHAHTQVKAEDHLNALLWLLLRDGTQRTRDLFVRALLAGQPDEVRDRVLAAGPPRAMMLWSQIKPDLALYSLTTFEVVLVVETKLRWGPSQANKVGRWLHKIVPDYSLATSNRTLADDLREYGEAWQLDSYACAWALWMTDDLVLVPSKATWLFWTGSDTATTASAYPRLITEGLWKIGRHTATADFLRPLLGTGAFGPNDEAHADLFVRMLDSPWDRCDPDRPLEVASAATSPVIVSASADETQS